MESETLEQTFDKYMRGKIESKEKKMEFLLKSKVVPLRAKLTKKMHEELVKAGFSSKDALEIICSGILDI